MRMTKKAHERMQERIGVLITGEIPLPYQILKGMLADEDIKVKVIAIGDVVAENLLKVDIEPEMIIVDGRSLRESVNTSLECDITVTNPQSEITEELVDAIKKGYRRIFVEGEEDLAALPAILYADEQSIIVYGQPGEGIMIIRPTEENKEKVRETLALFEGD
ncbi:MAG: DUF359 domain-containing protein [Theionarchaea archaeon]|nr:DUF359 domain-containing protein [Theionarchaea archaeon]